MAAIELEGRIESWCECIRSTVVSKGYGDVDIMQIDDICCPASGTCLGHDWTHGAVEKWWSLLMHSIYLYLCRVCSVSAKKLMTRVISLHIVFALACIWTGRLESWCERQGWMCLKGIAMSLWSKLMTYSVLLLFHIFHKIESVRQQKSDEVL
jgi:hypothetical protein